MIMARFPRVDSRETKSSYITLGQWMFYFTDILSSGFTILHTRSSGILLCGVPQMIWFKRKRNKINRQGVLTGMPDSGSETREGDWICPRHVTHFSQTSIHIDEVLQYNMTNYKLSQSTYDPVYSRFSLF